MSTFKYPLQILLVCLFIFNSASTKAIETQITATIDLENDIIDAAVNKDGVLNILAIPSFETLEESDSFTSNELLILNPENNEIQSRTIPEAAFSIIFSKKKNLGYLVGEQHISIFDGRKIKIKKRKNAEISESLSNSVALDENNNKLFVADGFNGISVFNSKNLKFLRGGALDNFVEDFALDETNGRLYISDQDHLITVVDTKSTDVIDTIDLIAKGISSDENGITIISGIAVDGKRQRIYFSLSQGSPQFGYYDLNSNSITEIPLTISTSDPPGLISFNYDLDLDKLYIQSCVNPRGADDEILIFDGSTQQISERIKNNSFITSDEFTLHCGTQFYFNKKDNKIYEIETGSSKILVLEQI